MRHRAEGWRIVTLALIGFGTATIAAGVALVAITPAAERYAVVLPVVQTTALLLAATVYVAAQFDH